MTRFYIVPLGELSRPPWGGWRGDSAAATGRIDGASLTPSIPTWSGRLPETTAFSFVELAFPILLLLGLFLLAGCNDHDAPDAYGNFEATETVVSAQADGPLLTFTVNEGDRLAEGEVVGLVDTTQLAAQRDALLAQRRNLLAQQRALLVQRAATQAQTGEADAGASALAAQLRTAEEEHDRTRRLFADDAATARELNEREGQVAQLRAQLDQARARARAIGAQADVPEAQAAALTDQAAGLDAQIRQIEDRLDNAAIENPTAGTVLAVVAARGEVVRTGAPLYTVADLSTLRLRAYATGNQLPRLRLGMPVEVLVDDGEGRLRPLLGEIVWIAAEAQFTPTPIQTREERAELVYAFDVRVPNPDGLLKVGMPGEVRFPAPSEDAR